MATPNLTREKAIDAVLAYFAREAPLEDEFTVQDIVARTAQPDDFERRRLERMVREGELSKRSLNGRVYYRVVV